MQTRRMHPNEILVFPPPGHESIRYDLYPDDETEQLSSYQSPSSQPPLIIGVGGASASGKTTVCKRIIASLHSKRCALISLDWFYHGLPADGDATAYNFDHPDAFDFDLVRSTLRTLKEGKSAWVPHYDFEHHRRIPHAERVEAADVIFLEGILALHDTLREEMDLKIFVDQDADKCLVRRLRRDLKERGRDVEDVLNQYERFVKPGFEQFILPTKRFADVVIPGEGNEVGVDVIRRYVEMKKDEQDGLEEVN